MFFFCGFSSEKLLKVDGSIKELSSFIACCETLERFLERLFFLISTARDEQGKMAQEGRGRF